MSAFVVSAEHLNVLLAAALHGPEGMTACEPGVPVRFDVAYHRPAFTRVGPDGESELHVALSPETIDEAGQMLLDANVAAVRGHYEQADERDMVPYHGYEGYTFTDPGVRLSAVAALKALDCLTYQCGEHLAWPSSSAHEFCERMRRAFIRALPGYHAAPWEHTA